MIFPLFLPMLPFQGAKSDCVRRESNPRLVDTFRRWQRRTGRWLVKIQGRKDPGHSLLPLNCRPLVKTCGNGSNLNAPTNAIIVIEIRLIIIYKHTNKILTYRKSPNLTPNSRVTLHLDRAWKNLSLYWHTKNISG